MTPEQALRHTHKPRADGALMAVPLMRWCGISYRQLDYWERSGYISKIEGTGQGSGTQRWFSPIEARRCWVLARYADMGSHGLARFALSLQSLDELEAGMILAWDGEMVEVIDTVLDFDKVVNFAGDRVLVLLKVPEFPF
jgi:hypothetical protein